MVLVPPRSLALTTSGKLSRAATRRPTSTAACATSMPPTRTRRCPCWRWPRASGDSVVTADRGHRLERLHRPLARARAGAPRPPRARPEPAAGPRREPRCRMGRGRPGDPSRAAVAGRRRGRGRPRGGRGRGGQGRRVRARQRRGHPCPPRRARRDRLAGTFSIPVLPGSAGARGFPLRREQGRGRAGGARPGRVARDRSSSGRRRFTARATVLPCRSGRSSCGAGCWRRGVPSASRCSTSGISPCCWPTWSRDRGRAVPSSSRTTPRPTSTAGRVLRRRRAACSARRCAWSGCRGRCSRRRQWRARVRPAGSAAPPAIGRGKVAEMFQRDWCCRRSTMAGIAWRPATAFDDGLAATLAWYRDKGQAAAMSDTPTA